MCHTFSRGLIANTIQRGWSIVFYFLALIAAMVFAAPCVHAADVDVTPSIAAGSKLPGGTYQLTGGYTINDGSTIISYKWEQEEGTAAAFSDDMVQNPMVTLGTSTEYAAHLIQVLKEPPITAADLPPDLNLQPINQIEKGLQDRNQVVAINPLALEKGEEVVLKFTVMTTSGEYSAELAVVTQLPWVTSTGVRTVPVMVSVLLYAKEDGGYNWEISSAPTGSTAALTDATTQTPWFTPDKVGTYLVEETNSGATLDIHAGSYHGVIDPVLTLNSVQFGDGLPVADPNCTSCHTVGGAAPDNFTPWRATGHAEAFTQGITTNGHFGESCFACHAVGYGLDGPIAPGGIDDTVSYTAFLNLLSSNQASGMIADTWEEMLQQMPDTARKSNIQCENCHGPNNYNDVHPSNDPDDIAARVSLSADVCGSCHGEPARHGRFQQWQLSNHADYELATSRSENGNCARCHSGNGFVAWDDLNFDPNQDVEVTWTEDEIVPQVCAACHNPHDTGSFSGGPDTNAKVRVNGDAIGPCGDATCDTYELVAGFMAANVGRGATCMTCHNSRRGLRNDATWASLTPGEKDDTPHHGVQADLIMGQNAYFINNLVRGKHSLIPDTCVTCHMEKTLPPDILSYNRGGTNHTFAADPNICAQCHGENSVTADNIDSIISDYLDDLKTALGAGWMRLMTANYPVTIDGACGTADVTNKGKGGVNNPITNVEWVYSRGTRLNVTVGSTTCSNLNPAAIIIGKVNKQEKNNTTLYDLSMQPGNDVLWKAMWNYGLLWEDETINEGDPPPHTARGVHNPDFSIKALTRAITAVEGLNP